MMVVIFELVPRDGQRSEYLDAALHSQPLLASVDGFIAVERFESLVTPGKLLSLSFWRDADAVRTWRQTAEHRAVQRAGRSSIFADYRLRVAEVVRDYGMSERARAPSDSRAVHIER